MTRKEFIDEVTRRAEKKDLSVDFGDAEGVLKIATELFGEVTQCRSCMGSGVSRTIRLNEVLRLPFGCEECDATGSRLR